MIRTALCPHKVSEPLDSFLPHMSLAQGATPTTHIFQTCSEVPWGDWYKVVPTSDTLWSQEYLSSIENNSAQNLNPYYVLIYEKEQPIFCAYFQQIEFVTSQIKSFTQDLSDKGSIKQWMFLQLSNLARRIVQLFRFRLLINGNSLLTSETGFRALPSIPAERHQELLTLALDEINCQIPKSIGVLLKDASIADRVGEWDPYWADKHYHKFFPDPEMILHLPAQWNSWEDYLGAMSSKYRQRAKSAYKKSKDIQLKTLDLEQIKESQDEIFALFQRIVSNEKFSLTQISSDYFFKLKEALGESFIFHAYYMDDELVAFATHIMSAAEPITHFVGLNLDLNQTKKLYQRILYDQVQLSLSYKGEAPLHLSLGRTAMEIKSTIGATAQAGPCYLHLRPKWMNRLAGPIMSNLKLDTWQPRHPFKEPISTI